MRRRWPIAVAVLVVLIAAWVFVARRGADGVAVDVDQVAKRDVFRWYVTASGEIVATRFADIGSSVMGRIVDLTVAEGDVVKAGQVLARIDPVQARSDDGLGHGAGARPRVRGTGGAPAGAGGDRGRGAGGSPRARGLPELHARAQPPRPGPDDRGGSGQGPGGGRRVGRPGQGVGCRPRPRAPAARRRRTARGAGARAAWSAPRTSCRRPRSSRRSTASSSRLQVRLGRDGRDRHPEPAGHDLDDRLGPQRRSTPR